MLHDPEFVSAILANAEDEEQFEFTEDFRERLSATSLFERAREFQIDLKDIQIEEQDLPASVENLSGIVQVLDAEATKKGLITEIVRLRGQGVELPELHTNPATGVTIISGADNTEVDEKSLEAYYRAGDVRGFFSGFTMRFIKDEKGTYTPRLAYQIVVKTVYESNAHITLCATGLVGVSEIAFEKDEKLDSIGPILERLFVLGDEKFQVKLNYLNIALATPKRHTADSLRRVARIADKIVNSAGDENRLLIEDGIIDLVAQYVEQGTPYHIKTAQFGLLAEGDAPGNITYFGGDDPKPLQGVVAGMLFMREVTVKEDDVTLHDSRGLHLLLNSDNRYAYVPLTEVQEFTKL